MEEWKSIQDYPGYSVSNLGRIKSDKACRGVVGRIMKLSLNKNLGQGYYNVRLTLTERRQRTLAVHRLVAEAFVEGRTDLLTEVDHIDGKSQDNRAENLRWVNRVNNCRNTGLRTNNKSGIRGVSIYGTRWRATINVDGKQQHLGVFDTLEEATAVYQEKAKELFGEFIRET